MKQKLRTFSSKLKKIRRNRSDKKLKNGSRYLEILERRKKKDNSDMEEIFKNDVVAENSSLEDIKKESTLEMGENNLISENLITFNLEEKLLNIQQEESDLFENGLQPAVLLKTNSQVFDTTQNEYITLRGGIWNL
jgi:hypothetical protein